jgi:hypothetical protein
MYRENEPHTTERHNKKSQTRTDRAKIFCSDVFVIQTLRTFSHTCFYQLILNKMINSQHWSTRCSCYIDVHGYTQIIKMSETIIAYVLACKNTFVLASTFFIRLSSEWNTMWLNSVRDCPSKKLFFWVFDEPATFL